MVIYRQYGKTMQRHYRRCYTATKEVRDTNSDELVVEIQLQNQAAGGGLGESRGASGEG